MEVILTVREKPRTSRVVLVKEEIWVQNFDKNGNRFVNFNVPAGHYGQLNEENKIVGDFGIGESLLKYYDVVSQEFVDFDIEGDCSVKDYSYMDEDPS